MKYILIWAISVIIYSITQAIGIDMTILKEYPKLTIGVLFSIGTVCQFPRVFGYIWREYFGCYVIVFIGCISYWLLSKYPDTSNLFSADNQIIGMFGVAFGICVILEFRGVRAFKFLLKQALILIGLYIVTEVVEEVIDNQRR